MKPPNKVFLPIQRPRLGHSILMTLSRQLLAILLGLGFSILIARALGPQGNGLFAIAILLPNLLNNFLNLGVSPANNYFVGRGEVSVTKAFHSGVRLWLIIAILGGVLAAGGILLYGEMLFPNTPAELLWIGFLIFPPNLLLAFTNSLLQGIQDFASFNRVLIIQPMTTLVAAAILIGIFGLGVAGALIASIIATVLTLLASWVALRPYIEPRKGRMSESPYIRRCLNYGWKAHLSNILAFVNYRTDIYIINLLLLPASAGLYVIAVQLGERLWLISHAVSTVLLPRLAELHTDELQRKRLTPLIARWTFYLTLISALALASLARFVINLLFGAEFVGAASALLWLLPGIVMVGLSRVLANDIAARGRPELNLYVAIAVVVVNIVGNVLLISILGIVGAAIATSIAYLLHALLQILIYSALSRNPWWSIVIFQPSDWDRVKLLLGRVTGKIA